MGETEVAAGGRLRTRTTKNPASVFAILGVLLLAAASVVPTFDRLLVAWGGTALFVALLLRFVMNEPTLSRTVTTAIYETMVHNARWWDGDSAVQYLPGDNADEDVTLAVAGDELEPVGVRLLASVKGETGQTLETHLSALVDILVNDLELAGRAQATTTEDGVTVTVTDSRVGVTELFDHPVASVFGVGLSRRLDTPVTVESTVTDGDLVVTLQLADEFLESPDADQHDEDDAADQ